MPLERVKLPSLLPFPPPCGPASRLPSHACLMPCQPLACESALTFSGCRAAWSGFPLLCVPIFANRAGKPFRDLFTSICCCPRVAKEGSRTHAQEILAFHCRKGNSQVMLSPQRGYLEISFLPHVTPEVSEGAWAVAALWERQALPLAAAALGCRGCRIFMCSDSKRPHQEIPGLWVPLCLWVTCLPALTCWTPNYQILEKTLPCYLSVQQPHTPR